MRETTRMNILLPVHVSGVDSNGCPFDDEACTLDVSASGARICGIHRSLTKDSIVTVRRGAYSANYRVIWSRNEPGAESPQIGVQLTENGSFIWGLVLRRQLADIDNPAQETLTRPPDSSSHAGGAQGDAAH